MVLAVTLARGGSKGIPNKNIRMLAGKPLLAWTIEEVQKCQYINKYIVSTDSKEIADVAEGYGVEVVMRPKRLAEDDTPSVASLQNAIEGFDHATIAMIPCTNPLKTHMDIDSALLRYSFGKFDSVIGVSETYPPERIKTLDNMMIRDTYPEPQDGQRQKLPKYYIRNGSFYILGRDLVDEGILFGHENSNGFIMPKGVNIDNELDWKLAEVLLENLTN
jgi:CMP-N-acetylneuraminic acid synthetase